MGRHKEWRKIAKKERRRKKRCSIAKEKDLHLNVSPEELLKMQQEQEAVEIMIYEQIQLSNMEEHRKWLESEKKVLERLQILQKKQEFYMQKKLEQEEKLRMEMQFQQEKMKQEEARLKEIEENNIKRQKLFTEKLEQFLSGDSSDPPEELLISKETRPGLPLCPFFFKTACCRFSDQCSRNHQYPSISRVLLATNFFNHFGLDNADCNEYDTDLMLEYEDGDTYKEFKQFYYDVLPEFEKFGQVIQFRTCYNHEKHLRGNVYLEYREVRCAVLAYRALNSRWYGGRQLSLKFCTIDAWHSAICGLHFKGKCPKGRVCNYLHVFRNPDNAFNYYTYPHDDINRREISSRSWRWSESPDRDSPCPRLTSSREVRRSSSRERRHPASKKREKDRRDRNRSRQSRHEKEKRSRRSKRSSEKDNQQD